MDLDVLPKKKQTEVVAEETKSPEILQLEAQKRKLRRQLFEARVSKLGIQANQVLTLDKLFQQQEFMKQQSLEQDAELETHHGMKI